MKRNSLRSRRPSGFTLLEMVIVLGIIGMIMGGVAIFAFGALSDSKKQTAAKDIANQLANLFGKRFLVDVPFERLQHYPRYLQAVEERLLQLEQNPLRDRQRQTEVEDWWRRYVEAMEAGSEYDEAMDAYRWLVHEFRVSRFAQRLGTAEKVSPKRLAEAWRTTGC